MVPACGRCNYSKRDVEPEVFVTDAAILERIVSYLRKVSND